MKHCINVLSLSCIALALLFGNKMVSQTCGTPISTFPYTEGFESGNGAWTQDTGDDFDWTRDSNGTPTNYTGPSVAHGGSYYMYTEADSPNYPTKTAIFKGPCFDLTSVSSATFSFWYHMNDAYNWFGDKMGTLSVELSTDNGSTYPTNLWSLSGSQGNTWKQANIDLTPYIGNTIKIRFRGVTNNGNRGDMAIDDISLTTPTPEINILGNSIITIPDGSTAPSLSDKTDFGSVDFNTGATIKTFIIQNLGNKALSIGSITFTGANASLFSISSPPNSTIAAGDSSTFSISFDPDTIGLKTATINISNNDSNENPYNFAIQGTGIQTFFDSDGDGILDNLDIDDDNDGILDTTEESQCESSSSNVVNYKFLNETFGTGSGRATIDINNYAATTTYCFEDGIAGTDTEQCPSQSTWILDDGEYTVVSKITGTVASDPENIHGDLAWYNGEDHTPGDTDGRMAVFNASFDPGVFYETTITGLLSNLPISYSFWALNIMTPGNFNGSILPDITVEFVDLNGNLLSTYNTGPFGRCLAGSTDNTCSQGEWHQFLTSVNLGGVNAVTVRFINNAPGGGGNDLALDDIVISQTICDTDYDGIANVFDLDDDNDGIPDVIEIGLGSYSEGKATLTGVSSWVDSNSNGMHDIYEAYTPADTDSDGVPDYIDLDSDNDGLFDVDEYGVINSNDASFQNGDGDINGDGVGDGIDSETFRDKDSDGDFILEGFGDGILDCYDFYENNTDYSDSYGNSNQGSGPLYALDSDSDGTPDYLDVYNDVTTTYDIDTVEIYASLPHTNGVLDNTTDADGDGVMASRDGDDTVFGSPRNLDASYSLYFDGRNDYVEDANVISTGEATLMAFIKSAGSNTNGDHRIIAGQNDFYLLINEATNIISAVVEGNVISAATQITNGIWTHVTITTKSGQSILYINGIEVANDTSGSIVDASNFTIGRGASDSNYFKGEIDEVRVFNSALTDVEIHRMMYQELDDSNSFNSGKIILQDICSDLGAKLVKYYKMDGYQDDILDDKKTAGKDVNGAKIYNVKDIYFQRAPLPYQTVSDGDWTNASIWLHGNEWDIMSKQNNPDDASIVHIKHNINLDGSYDTQGMVGLIVDASKEFSIKENKGLYNSWYLKIDGKIDLENESQLIQGNQSVLDATSAGTLERDQQGTKDLYTYNYWASPVGISNTTTNNNSYKLPDVMKDGAIASNPLNIIFLTSGYNGKPGSPGVTPVSIADYWIWKYANQISGNYPSWQHVRSTGTLLTGEGFTMKGVANTYGNISLEQNYVFIGKPNNGDITLTLSAGNDFLIGNPYASAIDADEFIKDNISVADGGRAASNIIVGTLYFWEHFASSTHVLKEYQGGYGAYTLIGGTPSVSNDSRINANGTLGTKTPQRYIPVGQGFFVTADAGGTVSFKNSQRIFKTEANDASVFMKSSTVKKTSHTDSENDTREKIRLLFDSPYGYHRQILAGVDSLASDDFDLGYDALLIENNKEDMFWVANDDHLVIQAVNNFANDQRLPLGVKIYRQGLTTIKIDSLENISNSLDILLLDKELNIYHDLKESNYEVYLTPGLITDRFEILFDNKTGTLLGTEDNEQVSLNVFYSNEESSLIIQNPHLRHIESAEMLNILGQSMFKFISGTNKNYLEFKTKQIQTGAYLIKIKTEDGTVSKKVLIK